MSTLSSLLPLAALGFALGWSVAWPPGPINAEIVRRGLAQGFWSAYGVGLGAASGDACWAVATVVGTGMLLGSERARFGLSVVSTLLLLSLAVLYLRGAWHGFARRRTGAVPVVAGRFAGGRGGYLLGLGLALSSPWNIAFWLAVVGRPEILRGGLAAALVIAGAVLLATNAWVVLLCSAVVVLRLRFAGAAWDVIASGATGLLMLGFAIDGVRRLI
jgi:threonine/homoserine/homoserine lactone efflux protein